MVMGPRGSSVVTGPRVEARGSTGLLARNNVGVPLAKERDPDGSVLALGFALGATGSGLLLQLDHHLGILGVRLDGGGDVRRLLPG